MSTRLKSPLPKDGGLPAEPQRLTVAMPIDVRSTSLAVLAVIALIVFLRWAQDVLIPIVFAVMLSYALTPVVNWLARNAKLPKAIGAAVTLAVILGGLGAGLSYLQPEALNILDLVPRATQKLSSMMHRNSGTPPGAVAKIQKAASEIEKVANTATSQTSTAATAPPKLAPDSPGFRIRDYVLTGTVGLATGLAQLLVVIVLAYFLLIAGDRFRRTLVRIKGDTLSKKKITVQILDKIDSQVQRYLLVQIATSALLGVGAWLMFAWIGLDNAVTWGCIGGVLHLIPYAGPAAFIALVALVSYVQFDTLQPVVMVVGSMLASIGAIALLVPWLTQKVANLNAVTVFVTLLVWGWLWGIWGLLLGVPIVMAIKAVCDRVEDLRAIGEFLGDAPGRIEPDNSDVTRVGPEPS